MCVCVCVCVPRISLICITYHSFTVCACMTIVSVLPSIDLTDSEQIKTIYTKPTRLR